MRATLTDKKNRAKCLAYRNGKRCNRLAKVEATFTDRRGHMHMALCHECAKAKNAEILQESAKGFTVTTSSFGPVQRFYHSIDEQEKQATEDTRSYAEEMAVGDLVAQDREWHNWVAQDSHSGGGKETGRCERSHFHDKK